MGFPLPTREDRNRRFDLSAPLSSAHPAKGDEAEAPALPVRLCVIPRLEECSATPHQGMPTLDVHNSVVLCFTGHQPVWSNSRLPSRMPLAKKLMLQKTIIPPLTSRSNRRSGVNSNRLRWKCQTALRCQSFRIF